MADGKELISPVLKELLVCPVDKSPLVERTELSGLECSECGRVYPVKEGIPVMLVDEASPPKKKRSEGKK